MQIDPKLEGMPVAEQGQELLQFLYYLVGWREDGVKPTTAANYTMGVRHHFLYILRKPDPLAGGVDAIGTPIKAIVKGLNRLTHQGPPKQSLPIAPEDLRATRGYILSLPHGKVLLACVLLAFEQLLRRSQCTVESSKQWNDAEHLSRADLRYIQYPEPAFLFFRKASKADQMGERYTRTPKVVPITDSPISAGRACLEMLWEYPTPPGTSPHQVPLFFIPGKGAMTYAQLNRVCKDLMTRRGYNAKNVSTHGLRRGGLQTLQALNHSPDVLTFFGCWSAFRGSIPYQQLRPARQREVARSMHTATLGSSPAAQLPEFREEGWLDEVLTLLKQTPSQN